MVRDLCRHVLKAAASIGTPLELLPDTEVAALNARIRDRFFRRYLDWNYFAVETSTSGRKRAALLWLDDFLKGREAYLLLYDGKPQDLRIPHATALVPILKECYGFEVYLTDSEASYILVFNDHDVLIAAGDALEWLIECREQDEEEKLLKAQSKA